MTDEKLQQISLARNEVSGWEAILDDIAALKEWRGRQNFYLGVTETMVPPPGLFLSYKDKLTAWAQDGLAKAKEEFARL